MATLLALVEQTRRLLSDFGGDNEVPWALDDGNCDTDNETLVAYLDKGREELAVRVPIRDASTPALTRITLAADASGALPLSARVLWLREVRLVADDARLPYRPLRDLERQYGNGWLTQTGMPACWTYLEDHLARLVPAPAVTTALALVVDRLPLLPLAWADREAEVVDVPPPGEDALLYWAAYRATETVRNQADMGLAERWLARFTELAGPRPNARQLAERRRQAAGPVRVTPLTIGNRI